MIKNTSLVFMQILAYHKEYVYNVWYNNLLLLITAIGLYELFSRMKSITLIYKFAQIISKYSFAIYLTHNIVKELIAVPIKSIPINRPLKTTILTILCFMVSFAISVMVSRIPKIGKYILYMK